MVEEVTIVALILNDGTTLELVDSKNYCDNCHFFKPLKPKMSTNDATANCPKRLDRLICMMSEDNANKVFKIKK
jgi:hypothetical protein